MQHNDFKITVFLDVTQCSLVDKYLRFGGAWYNTSIFRLKKLSLHFHFVKSQEIVLLGILVLQLSLLLYLSMGIVGSISTVLQQLRLNFH
jgi:hypothetical protein